MAVHPNSPNANNNINDEEPERLLVPPPAPNPNNGIMAAPNNFRPFGGGLNGAFGRHHHHHHVNGMGPRQYFPPAQQPPPQPVHHHHHNQLIAPRNPGVAAPANLLEDDEDDHEEPGPILVKVHCPVIIKGDNNVCSVDPAILTQRITMAVARSLRTMGGGVPMVDGNGAPREIRVDVQAETRIEGSKNMVGEKYNHLVVKAEEEDEVIIVDEDGVAEDRRIENGNGGPAAGAGGRGKRKAAAAVQMDRQIKHQEPNVARAGLRIKLEPLDNQEEQADHSVKRPRHE